MRLIAQSNLAGFLGAVRSTVALLVVLGKGAGIILAYAYAFAFGAIPIVRTESERGDDFDPEAQTRGSAARAAMDHNSERSLKTADPRRLSRVTEALGWAGALAIFVPLAWWVPHLARASHAQPKADFVVFSFSDFESQLYLLVLVYALFYLPLGVTGIALAVRARHRDDAAALTLLGLVLVAIVLLVLVSSGVSWAQVLLFAAPGLLWTTAWPLARISCGRRRRSLRSSRRAS